MGRDAFLGKLQKRKIKEMGVGGRFSFIYFIVIGPKGGNVSLERRELKFWRVEVELSFFFLPSEIKNNNKKNHSFISAAVQLQDCFGAVPRPIPVTFFFWKIQNSKIPMSIWKWRENPERSECTSGNVLTKAFFLAKNPSAEPWQQRGTKFHYM